MSNISDFAAERNRIAEMLSSIDAAFDRNTDSGKAAILRAITGSTEPQWEMAAICSCGWRGTFNDIGFIRFDSGPDSWTMHAGRRGYHYPCPDCGEIIWRYYHTIN
jgi:hypothetical protein